MNSLQLHYATPDFKGQTEVRAAPPKKSEGPYATIDKEKLVPFSEDVNPEPG